MILNKAGNEHIEELSKTNPWTYEPFREMMLKDKAQQLLAQDKLLQEGKQPTKNLVELVADLFIMSAIYLAGEQDLIATRIFDAEKFTNQMEQMAKLQRGQTDNEF